MVRGRRFLRRLRTQGWKILYCPEAVFDHRGGHILNQLSLRERQLLWYCNLLRHFRKHSSLLAVAKLRVCIALGMALRFFAAFAGFGPEDAGLREALGAYARVMQKCVLKAPVAERLEKR